MMRLSNGSLSSLGSNKDKDLPPVPSPLSTLHPVLVGDDTAQKELLQAKTLRRKNFKQLSLDSSANSAQPDADSTLFARIEASSLQLRRNKLRPAPLANLDHPIDVSSDPDAHTSKNVMIKQLSNLDLDLKPLTLRAQTILRKRQTVISSISPTKSTAPSPKDPSMAKKVLTISNNHNSEFNLSDEGLPISTTSLLKLNNKDLLTLKSLGSGNSGTVSKILHIPTQKTMAKKVIHIDLKSVIQTQIIRELRIIHECHSPYIIEFFGAFINNSNTVVICMEYCNCGSLDKILPLCENHQFPVPVLKKLSFSMLLGLSYLYTVHKIIHRDIKPSNVLMTHKGEFKLADFGVLRELTNSLAMADTFVGTSTYMSPERIQGFTYGVKSDVWSMGLMLIELSSGKHVWADDDAAEGLDNSNPAGPEGILDLLQRIVNETPPTLSKKTNPRTKQPYDPQLCVFVDSCLVKDDKVRKSPRDLLSDKDGFLRGVENGVFDREVKNWAKSIRKHNKDKSEN